ncbi:MAG TPA: 50S ribosomal protein L32e [Candidatus Methanofastidiosa archaeon]|nr:50S ribosomal protein L32e [Candidatus Methanofastidiosa archaeon]HPR42333.1 50S ribosomal protein L32e [Candidatus Methanofastidiosa archaeon]
MTERLLKLRKEASKKRPKFKRQETWKLKRFKNNPTWRKPKGHSSKMRRKLKGRPSIVKVGYRGPKEVRGYHPCGLPEVYINNLSDVEGSEGSILRISSSIGNMKKADILLRAKELDLKVANPGVKFLYVDSVEALERYAPIKNDVKEFKLSSVEDDVRDDIVDKAKALKMRIEAGE